MNDDELADYRREVIERARKRAYEDHRKKTEMWSFILLFHLSFIAISLGVVDYLGIAYDRSGLMLIQFLLGIATVIHFIRS